MFLEPLPALGADGVIVVRKAARVLLLRALKRAAQPQPFGDGLHVGITGLSLDQVHALMFETIEDPAQVVAGAHGNVSVFGVGDSIPSEAAALRVVVDTVRKGSDVWEARLQIIGGISGDCIQIGPTTTSTKSDGCHEIRWLPSADGELDFGIAEASFRVVRGDEAVDRVAQHDGYRV